MLGAGAFIRSTFGFGDALFAMPILTLAVGVATATPVVALVALPIVIVILATSWREVSFASVRLLIAGAAVGVPIGAVLIKNAPEEVLSRVLGVILIAFGLYRLLAPSVPYLKSRALAPVFGFASGCMAGAYNTGGPPVVVYGALRRWGPERFRATLQGYFAFTTVVVVASHGLAGLWSERVLLLAAAALLPALLGTWLGARLNERFAAETFERYLSVLLVILGVLLLI